MLIAIGITTTMDATGLTVFSALPLFPLALVYWYLQRLPRREVGLAWGQWRHYGLAALYPASVLSLVAAAGAAGGAIDLSHTDWEKTLLNLAAGTLGTFLMVIITEEGFFRGWLWAALQRSGLNGGRTLVATSIAFSLWHLSWVTLTADGKLPVAQIPVFMVNAAVMGAIWGLLRWLSGSIIVASLSHGLWNGVAYALFGFGEHVGALGLKPTILYGPESGVFGLLLNFAFALLLWRRMMREQSAVPQIPA